MQEGERIPYEDYKTLCRQHPGEYLCDEPYDEKVSALLDKVNALAEEKGLASEEEDEQLSDDAML